MNDPLLSGARPKFHRRVKVRAVDVEYCSLAELPVGALTLEGLVLSVSLFAHTYTTVGGTYEVDSETQQVPVFARVDADIVEATQARVAEVTR